MSRTGVFSGPKGFAPSEWSLLRRSSYDRISYETRSEVVGYYEYNKIVLPLPPDAALPSGFAQICLRRLQRRNYHRGELSRLLVRFLVGGTSRLVSDQVGL